MSNDLDALWAWVTELPDGSVSLISVGLPGIGHAPICSHDKDLVMHMEPIAKAHGDKLGQPVWLRRYLVSEDIGRITATLRQRH